MVCYVNNIWKCIYVCMYVYSILYVHHLYRYVCMSIHYLALLDPKHTSTFSTNLR